MNIWFPGSILSACSNCNEAFQTDETRHLLLPPDRVADDGVSKLAGNPLVLCLECLKQLQDPVLWEKSCLRTG